MNMPKRASRHHSMRASRWQGSRCPGCGDGVLGVGLLGEHGGGEQKTGEAGGKGATSQIHRQFLERDERQEHSMGKRVVYLQRGHSCCEGRQQRRKKIEGAPDFVIRLRNLGGLLPVSLFACIQDENGLRWGRVPLRVAGYRGLRRSA